MTLPLLPTGLVGSYAQPNWLIDRARLGERLPPRVRAAELWRVAPEDLAEAQRDATILAVEEQLRAGVDFVTDGEIRRESYSNRFANALAGIDLDNPGEAIDRTGKAVPVPRVTGPIKRRFATELDNLQLLQQLTDKPIKVTLPGPFTMAQQAQNDYYPDAGSLAMALAEAVNEEVRDLFAAGADMVQLDEPYVQARPKAAREYAVTAIDKALTGSSGTTVLHVCFGYGKHVADKPNGYDFLAELNNCTVQELSLECAQPQLPMQELDVVRNKRLHVGVLNLRDLEPETPALVAERIKQALTVVPLEQLIVAPDCGLKYLPRDVAYRKLCAMVAGRNLVRDELGMH